MALLHADGGSARIAGLECWKDSLQIKRLIGYTPGEPALDPNLTGGQILAYFRHLRGRLDHPDRKQPIQAVDLGTRPSFPQHWTGHNGRAGLIQDFMYP